MNVHRAAVPARLATSGLPSASFVFTVPPRPKGTPNFLAMAPDRRRYFFHGVPLHPQECDLSQFPVAQRREEPLALLRHLDRPRVVGFAPEHCFEHAVPGALDVP